MNVQGECSAKGPTWMRGKMEAFILKQQSHALQLQMAALRSRLEARKKNA